MYTFKEEGQTSLLWRTSRQENLHVPRGNVLKMQKDWAYFKDLTGLFTRTKERRFHLPLFGDNHISPLKMMLYLSTPT